MSAIWADCAVEVGGNSYCVPWRFIGESAEVTVAGGRVRIRHAGAEERRSAVERLQSRRLVALEALARRLAGRAVHADIGDLTHPPGKMRFERRPTGKDMAGDRVAFDIVDAALVPRVKPKGRLSPLVRAR